MYLLGHVIWQSTFTNRINKWYRKSSQAAGLEYPRVCDCFQFYQPSYRPLLPAVPFCVHTEQLDFRGKQSTFDSIGGKTESENLFLITTAVRLLVKLFPIFYMWSLYRPGLAQRVGRGIALLFHDRGTRRGWVVSSTPRPHITHRKQPVPILQEAGWAPGPVWKGGKSRPHRDSIPDHPAGS